MKQVIEKVYGEDLGELYQLVVGDDNISMLWEGTPNYKLCDNGEGVEITGRLGLQLSYSQVRGIYLLLDSYVRNCPDFTDQLRVTRIDEVPVKTIGGIEEPDE